MKITILRHGKPVIPSLKRISAASFSDWVDAYNAAGLCQTSKASINAHDQANDCNVIVCSELPRSLESAKELNKAHVLISCGLFNEAGLPVANWRKPKLSPKVWAVAFRILWLFGYSRNSESFKEAKQRASNAVEKLTEIAQEHERVLFVGHGVYNRILAKELRRLGWSGPKNPGTKHWSYGVYECTKT